jgi:hypothetical protein
LSSIVVTLTPDPPSADPPPPGGPVINQTNRTFAPAIVFARTGQPVTFANSDPELHNIDVKNAETKEQSFNVALLNGGTYAYKFDHDGFYDVRCDIHTDMYAAIVVSSSPYALQSEPDRSFTFEGVPEGRYTLKVYAGKDVIVKPVAVTAPVTDIELN